jgi:hypothetical protein
MEDSTLQLGYDFITDPLVLHASIGSNPNTLALTVMISVPGSDSVTVQSLSITIPMGKDLPGDLGIGNLPAPTCNDPDHWSIQVNAAGNFTINPAQLGGGNLGAQSLQVQFFNIAINNQPGTVPITITEIVDNVTNTDGNTYTLVKQPPLTPVSGLVATPASICARQTSTITWATAETGGPYGFSISIAGPGGYAWSSCAPGTACLSVNDGVKGVSTPQLQDNGAYTITLDVYQNGTLQPYSPTTPLLVTVPDIYTYDCSLASYMGGYRYPFTWATINASRCALYNVTDTGSDLLLDNLPPNAVGSGYVVWRDPSWPTTIHFQLRAYDAADNFDTYAFDPTSASSSTFTPGEGFAAKSHTGMAASVDSKFFYAGCTPELLHISADGSGQTNDWWGGAFAPAEAPSVAMVRYDASQSPNAAAFVGYYPLQGINHAAVWVMAPAGLPSSALDLGAGTSGTGNKAVGVAADIPGLFSYVISTDPSVYWVNTKMNPPQVVNTWPLDTPALAVAAGGPVNVFLQDAEKIYLVLQGALKWKFPCPLLETDNPVLKLVSNELLYAFAQGKLYRLESQGGTNPQTLQLPGTPFAMDIAGGFAFITIVGQNNLVIVDLEQWAVLPQTIPFPSQPYEVAVTPDGLNLAVRIGDPVVSAPAFVIFSAQGPVGALPPRP